MTCGATTGLPENFPNRDINIKSMPRSKYIRYLEHRGIFIPKRVAHWELEPNAYVELLVSDRRVACTAIECICEKGRDFSTKTGTSEIIKCITCGGRAIHTGCSDLQEDNVYICGGTNSIVFIRFYYSHAPIIQYTYLFYRLLHSKSVSRFLQHT